jgi:hypothetical protein
MTPTAVALEGLLLGATSLLLPIQPRAKSLRCPLPTICLLAHPTITPTFISHPTPQVRYPLGTHQHQRQGLPAVAAAATVWEVIITQTWLLLPKQRHLAR